MYGAPPDCPVCPSIATTGIVVGAINTPNHHHSSHPRFHILTFNIRAKANTPNTQSKHSIPSKLQNQLNCLEKAFKKRMKIKRRTLIKGEMKIMKTRKMIKKFRIKDHRTQESTKQFKEITLSTPYLVTSTRW
jgi:hypothetical protein